MSEPPFVPAAPQPPLVTPELTSSSEAGFAGNTSLGTAVIALSGAYLLLVWWAVIWPSALQPPVAVFVAVPVAVWMVTSVWLAIAYGNARLLEPGSMRRSPAWTWLGWVVPIVSLWFPKQIVDDCIEVTEGAVHGRRCVDIRTQTAPWWTFWIASMLLRISIPWTDAVGQAGPSPAMASAIAVSVAFVFWIRIVRRLTALQDQLAAHGPQWSD